ncbi:MULTISPECIES: hypothetical protein [unclassified Streptomyces]|uniref:hypothetical protein n=1 Tax=unclassified Streptomyces TaxID=2593676 RepID=UPI0036ECDCD4
MLAQVEREFDHRRRLEVLRLVYASGGDVDDRGQIEPAFFGRDIRDVAAPAGI